MMLVGMHYTTPQFLFFLFILSRKIWISIESVTTFGMSSALFWLFCFSPVNPTPKTETALTRWWKAGLKPIAAPKNDVHIHSIWRVEHKWNQNFSTNSILYNRCVFFVLFRRVPTIRALHCFSYEANAWTLALGPCPNDTSQSTPPVHSETDVGQNILHSLECKPTNLSQALMVQSNCTLNHPPSSDHQLIGLLQRESIIIIIIIHRWCYLPLPGLMMFGEFVISSTSFRRRRRRRRRRGLFCTHICCTSV